MKAFLVFALVVSLATPAAAQIRSDDLDLHTVIIHRSPPVADWPVTVGITRVDMDPQGGVALTFDRAVPERWKFFSNPEVASDNFQFTVWACVQRRHCAGFVQMWQGRSMTNHSLPPILSDSVNWWGDVRHLWDEMSDYRPQAGDAIGFLVTAGNGRLTSGVSSVAERSNVVVMALPAGDSGHFTFDGAVVAPVPVPTPTPTPQPTPAPLPTTDLAPILSQLQQCIADVRATNQNVSDGRVENQAFYTAVSTQWKNVLKNFAVYGLPIIGALVAGRATAK